MTTEVQGLEAHIIYIRAREVRTKRRCATRARIQRASQPQKTMRERL